MARRKSVLLAIDAANHAIEAKESGATLNFGAALAYAAELGEVRFAGFYGARVNGLPERDRQQLILLKQAGFNRIVIRPLRQRADGSAKSDIDTVIAMDVWGAAVRREIDVVVLLSGDSDFVPLVERLVDQGIEAHVIGPERCTAWELAAAATYFLYAGQLEGFARPAASQFGAPAERPQPEPERTTTGAPAERAQPEPERLVTVAPTSRNGACPSPIKPG